MNLPTWPTWQASAMRTWQVTVHSATVTARDGYFEWAIAEGGSLELFSRDTAECHDPGGWGWTAVMVEWEDGECRACVTRRTGDCDGTIETVTDYTWVPGKADWIRTYDRTSDERAAAMGY